MVFGNGVQNIQAVAYNGARKLFIIVKLVLKFRRCEFKGTLTPVYRASKIMAMRKMNNRYYQHYHSS